MHSLTTLLEKSRAEEQALAAGVVRYSARRLFRIDSLIGWMSEMWDPRPARTSADNTAYS